MALFGLRIDDDFSIGEMTCSLQMQQPGQRYALPMRMIKPSGILDSSCYICSAAVKCGLEECITLGALDALVMS